MTDQAAQVTVPRAVIGSARVVLDPDGAAKGAVLSFALASGEPMSLGLAADQAPLLLRVAALLEAQVRAKPSAGAPAQALIPVEGWSTEQRGAAVVLTLRLAGGGGLAFQVEAPADNVKGV